MALSGWLKLHRALSDHPIASDAQSLSVWIHLLMLANHVETKRQINGRIVTLAPGQLIASRKSLSAKTGVQESKVERVLKMLQNEQQIEQHGTSKYRVISIVNWRLYQTDEQEIEQQANSRRTTDEQHVNTPEECKEYKECKEEIKSSSCEAQERSRKPDEDPDFERAWKLYPKREGANPKNKALSAWKARRKEGVSVESMIEGLARYAAFSAAKGNVGTEYIMQGARFFGPGMEFENEWKAAPASQAVSRHHGFEQRDYFEGLTQREDGSWALK